VLGHTGIFERDPAGEPGVPAVRPGTQGLRCPACLEPVVVDAARSEVDPTGAARVVCGSCGERVLVPVDPTVPSGPDD
jgi:hypothetical protein